MPEFHILNLGAGVQSTMLYLWSIDIQAAPKFDYAIFADTQEEPKAVYQHLEWLKTLGGPPILVRTAGALGVDLVSGKRAPGAGRARFASIPAFTIIEGEKPGQTRRQCSREYKIDVIDRTIRREILGLKFKGRIPKDTTVHQYFGISFDERSRASRIWERYHITGESKFVPHFPLVERMITRANCLDYLKKRVPHEVPRSACVFCPFHTDLEWQRLKDRGGEDWQRAIEIDRLLRTPGVITNRDMRPTMYLHLSCQPIDQVDFRPRTNPKEMQLGFDVECEGVCGV